MSSILLRLAACVDGTARSLWAICLDDELGSRRKPSHYPVPSRPANISRISGHIQLTVYGLPSALVTLQGSVVGTPVTRPTDYTAGDFGYLIAVRRLHGQPDRLLGPGVPGRCGIGFSADPGVPPVMAHSRRTPNSEPASPVLPTRTSPHEPDDE